MFWHFCASLQKDTLLLNPLRVGHNFASFHWGRLGREIRWGFQEDVGFSIPFTAWDWCNCADICWNGSGISNQHISITRWRWYAWEVSTNRKICLPCILKAYKHRFHSRSPRGTISQKTWRARSSHQREELSSHTLLDLITWQIIHGINGTASSARRKWVGGRLERGI